MRSFIHKLLLAWPIKIQQWLKQITLLFQEREELAYLWEEKKMSIQEMLMYELMYIKSIYYLEQQR